jgi:hypothetical protein
MLSILADRRPAQNLATLVTKKNHVFDPLLHKSFKISRPWAPTLEDEMPVDTPSLFSKVIQDHLDLKRRNAALESRLPIGRYRAEDPFDNHPLFKTEEQARLEETMDGVEPAVLAHSVAWPGEEALAGVARDDGLWTRSRDFDWGD